MPLNTAARSVGWGAALSLLLWVTSPRTARADEGFAWNIFSDVNFAASSGDEHSAFRVGGVDLFATAELSDTVRVLSENVLEILHGDPVFDLERIYLEWDLASLLTVRAGRTHTPLGSYMQAYHHALLFQLATSRPVMLGFEDEGGLLPAHLIGMEAFGRKTMGDVTWGYTVGVGNGRGQFSDDVLSVEDRNRFKAVVARATASLDALGGIELGVSGYLDRIPSGYTDPSTGVVVVPESLDELILCAHVAAPLYPLQFAAEAYYLRHETRRSNRMTRLFGGFAQVGYSIADFTPYARVDVVDRDSGDTFFNASGSPIQAFNLLGGVRYELHERATLKVEYTRAFEERIHLGTAQVAFGF